MVSTESPASELLGHQWTLGVLWGPIGPNTTGHVSELKDPRFGSFVTDACQLCVIVWEHGDLTTFSVGSPGLPKGGGWEKKYDQGS